MPGFLLHLGAIVQCSHGGTATPVATNPRVTVGGQPIVTMISYVVAGCAFPPPPAANGPCVTATFVTMATRVFAGGMPLLLSDSQAIAAPTGTPLIIVSTQVKTKGT